MFNCFKKIIIFSCFPLIVSDSKQKVEFACIQNFTLIYTINLFKNKNKNTKSKVYKLELRNKSKIVYNIEKQKIINNKQLIVLNFTSQRTSNQFNQRSFNLRNNTVEGKLESQSLQNLIQTYQYSIQIINFNLQLRHTIHHKAMFLSLKQSQSKQTKPQINQTSPTSKQSQQFSWTKTPQQTKQSQAHSIYKFYQDYIILQKSLQMQSAKSNYLTNFEGKEQAQSQQKEQQQILHLKYKKTGTESIRMNGQRQDHIGIKVILQNKEEKVKLIQKLQRQLSVRRNIKQMQGSQMANISGIGYQESSKLQQINSYQLIKNYYIEQVNTLCSNYIYLYVVFERWQGSVMNKFNNVLIGRINRIWSNSMNSIPSNPINSIPNNPLNGIPSNPINSIPNNPLNGIPSNPMKNSAQHNVTVRNYNKIQGINKHTSTSTSAVLRNIDSSALGQFRNPSIAWISNKQQLTLVNESQDLEQFQEQIRRQLIIMVRNVVNGLQKLYELDNLPLDLKIGDILYNTNEQNRTSVEQNQLHRTKQDLNRQLYLVKNTFLSNHSVNLSPHHFVQNHLKNPNKHENYAYLHIQSESYPSIQNQTYPSPEQLNAYNNTNYDINQQFSSLLFKLGMIVVQLWQLQRARFNRNMLQGNDGNEQVVSSLNPNKVQTASILKVGIQNTKPNPYCHTIKSNYYQFKQLQTDWNNRAKPNNLKPKLLITKVNWLQINCLLQDILLSSQFNTHKDIIHHFYLMLRTLLNRSAMERKRVVQLVNGRYLQVPFPQKSAQLSSNFVISLSSNNNSSFGNGVNNNANSNFHANGNNSSNKNSVYSNGYNGHKNNNAVKMNYLNNSLTKLQPQTYPSNNYSPYSHSPSSLNYFTNTTPQNNFAPQRNNSARQSNVKYKQTTTNKSINFGNSNKNSRGSQVKINFVNHTHVDSNLHDKYTGNHKANSDTAQNCRGQFFHQYSQLNLGNVQKQFNFNTNKSIQHVGHPQDIKTTNIGSILSSNIESQKLSTSLKHSSPFGPFYSTFQSQSIHQRQNINVDLTQPPSSSPKTLLQDKISQQLPVSYYSFHKDQNTVPQSQQTVATNSIRESRYLTAQQQKYIDESKQGNHKQQKEQTPQKHPPKQKTSEAQQQYRSKQQTQKAQQHPYIQVPKQSIVNMYKQNSIQSQPESLYQQLTTYIQQECQANAHQQNANNNQVQGRNIYNKITYDNNVSQNKKVSINGSNENQSFLPQYLSVLKNQQILIQQQQNTNVQQSQQLICSGKSILDSLLPQPVSKDKSPTQLKQQNKASYNQIPYSNIKQTNQSQRPKSKLSDRRNSQSKQSEQPKQLEQKPEQLKQPEQLQQPQYLKVSKQPEFPQQLEQPKQMQQLQEQPQYTIKQYLQGARYQGYMVKNQRQGHGKFFYSQGSYYQGQWLRDRMNGYGKLYYNTGHLAYEGDWESDEFHGQGKVYNDSPTMLDESFDYTNFNNLQEQWAYYEGQLRNDLKQGYGTIMLQNGEYLQGHFKKDRINGSAKFVNLQAEQIHGIWKNSIMIERLQN